MRYCAEQSTERPQVTLNGAKFISMQLGQVQFKDPMSYLVMPFSRMPKTFGTTEMVKVYFPHVFNTGANYHAFLPHLPENHLYDPITGIPKNEKISTLDTRLTRRTLRLSGRNFKVLLF